ncbi:hypothetical protein [Paraburkholderia sp. BL17N1]|uniref:hypothetical protein n=1 Tax=Paraburkholderia sp. BL17N1 TaxID=1938798 RepID=UPI000F18ED99|nr:hypothetical protein [Paraburkholderia sp. BL17N1]RKR43617.1 hypothetical protein B0G82_1193 [Paraburkholderia sp. BL17N1]
MMKWFVNDLSLHGQFNSHHDFLDVLRSFLQLRHKSPALTERLHCSRNLHAAMVTPQSNFREAVQRSADQALRRAVLEWIASKGPFWDDSRLANADDYFELNGVDVTNSGVGEAVRQVVAGAEATTYSFQGSGFDYSPISIEHGLPEDRLGRWNLTNLWTCDQLLAAANSAEEPPRNWQQAIESARRRFDRLVIGPEAATSLQAEPYSPYVVERIFELLRVLQEFVESRNTDGTYSDETKRLIADHFSGEKAWFSGESDGNERDFREKLTFKDFGGSDTLHFCPWHGKIKTPQFRIHFPWPMDSTQKVINIFYIGPKITKK